MGNCIVILERAAEERRDPRGDLIPYYATWEEITPFATTTSINSVEVIRNQQARRWHVSAVTGIAGVTEHAVGSAAVGEEAQIEKISSRRRVVCVVLQIRKLNQSMEWFTGQ